MTHKTAKALHDDLYRNDAAYAIEYDALEEQFSVASVLIRARKNANLTQAELAVEMKTTQAQIARMEGGKMPSMRTLEKLAIATGTQVKITLEPVNH